LKKAFLLTTAALILPPRKGVGERIPKGMIAKKKRMSIATEQTEREARTACRSRNLPQAMHQACWTGYCHCRLDSAWKVRISKMRPRKLWLPRTGLGTSGNGCDDDQRLGKSSWRGAFELPDGDGGGWLHAKFRCPYRCPSFRQQVSSIPPG